MRRGSWPRSSGADGRGRVGGDPRLEEALRTGAPLRLPRCATRALALNDEALPATLRGIEVTSGIAADLRPVAHGWCGASAPTITRDLVVAHTRALKLPGVARHFEALARQAQEAHWTYEDYLHEVLSAEQVSRHESVIRQRLREARFPEVKTLDTFDFASAEGLNPAQVQTLARGEWVTRPENLILARPIGTGKTHRGDRAGRRGRRGRNGACSLREPPT